MKACRYPMTRYVCYGQTMKPVAKINEIKVVSPHNLSRSTKRSNLKPGYIWYFLRQQHLLHILGQFQLTFQITALFFRKMLKAYTSGIIDFQEFWFNVFMTNLTFA